MRSRGQTRWNIAGLYGSSFSKLDYREQDGHRPDVVVCVLVETERQFCPLFNDPVVEELRGKT